MYPDGGNQSKRRYALKDPSGDLWILHRIIDSISILEAWSHKSSFILGEIIYGEAKEKLNFLKSIGWKFMFENEKDIYNN